MTFSLRPATEDDVDAIHEIELLCHRESTAWSREGILGELRKPYCEFQVLTDDETDSVIAGYIVFWRIFDEVHLLNVAVAPTHRGLGHAKRMVQRVVNYAVANHAKRILLEVRKSNAAAVQLYQSQGFVITHVRKGFYSDGEDAYQMAIFLEGDKSSGGFAGEGTG